MSQGKKRGAIFIVAGDPAHERSLRRRLEKSGYEPESFTSVEQLLAGYDGAQPACIVASPSLLEAYGLPQETKVTKPASASPLVVVSGQVVLRILRAIRSGDISLLPEAHSRAELLGCISKTLTADVRHHRQRVHRREIQQRVATLTAGERQVLDLVAAGNANKVIARKLRIAMRTVERRRQRILEKMHADSLAEVVRIVVEAERRNNAN